MEIRSKVLESICKNMIETILDCVPGATKGTIYRVDPMPDLRVTRVTSGVRNHPESTIRWGLPASSDYNPPGKTWKEYRDQQASVLEAMGWCVERQKSWSADDPNEDVRSVRKQLHGENEDYHHMEPVLVPKSDLYPTPPPLSAYPLTWNGEPIWQDTDYVVAAVVKIHFLPNSIHRGDRSTKIIKRLSRALGTQLLSSHLQEAFSLAQKDLARQRLQTCNSLAHELRNALAKLSFVFPAINAEVSFLREQWEREILRNRPELDDKRRLLRSLTGLINRRVARLDGNTDLAEVAAKLLADQEQLTRLSLLPEQEIRWLEDKIGKNWERLLTESAAWEEDEAEIRRVLDRLRRVAGIGTDPTLVSALTHLPEDLRDTWARVAYTDFSVNNSAELQEVILLLDHPALALPHKYQTKKVLTSLKALVELMPEIEERANRMILSLKNGNSPDHP